MMNVDHYARGGVSPIADSPMESIGRRRFMQLLMGGTIGGVMGFMPLSKSAEENSNPKQIASSRKSVQARSMPSETTKSQRARENLEREELGLLRNAIGLGGFGLIVKGFTDVQLSEELRQRFKNQGKSLIDNYVTALEVYERITYPDKDVIYPENINKDEIPLNWLQEAKKSPEYWHDPFKGLTHQEYPLEELLKDMKTALMVIEKLGNENYSRIASTILKTFETYEDSLKISI